MITLRAGLLALALVAGAVPAAFAEPYPARPVTIVVPFPPGPIAYQDADEFKAWWDRDAAALAEVIKRIGQVDSK
jgi:hypothetical protein